MFRIHRIWNLIHSQGSGSSFGQFHNRYFNNFNGTPAQFRTKVMLNFWRNSVDEFLNWNLAGFFKNCHPSLYACVSRFGDHERHPHPTDCAYFYACLNTGQPRLLGCTKPTVFNPETGLCDKPELVKGCEDYYPPGEDEEERKVGLLPSGGGGGGT